jgi:hypothetical protein
VSAVVISELEQLVPDVINMLSASEAAELAVVAGLVEALGKALVDAIEAKNFDEKSAIAASDVAALDALRLRFPK